MKHWKSNAKFYNEMFNFYNGWKNITILHSFSNVLLGNDCNQVSRNIAISIMTEIVNFTGSFLLDPSPSYQRESLIDALEIGEGR